MSHCRSKKAGGAKLISVDVRVASMSEEGHMAGEEWAEHGRLFGLL